MWNIQLQHFFRKGRFPVTDIKNGGRKLQITGTPCRADAPGAHARSRVPTGALASRKEPGTGSAKGCVWAYSSCEDLLSKANARNQASAGGVHSSPKQLFLRQQQMRTTPGHSFLRGSAPCGGHPLWRAENSDHWNAFAGWLHGDKSEVTLSALRGEGSRVRCPAPNQISLA